MTQTEIQIITTNAKAQLSNKAIVPLAIAGVLMAQALQMYKTMLPEGDYKQLAEELPNMAEQANKWEIDNATKLH